MANRQLQFGVLGDSHARRLYGLHVNRPAFACGVIPYKAGREQRFITHLLHATDATPFYRPQPHALPHNNIHQKMAEHRQSDAILITGGGNNLDSTYADLRQ